MGDKQSTRWYTTDSPKISSCNCLKAGDSSHPDLLRAGEGIVLCVAFMVVFSKSLVALNPGSVEK
jgi:hypothetical protein